MVQDAQVTSQKRPKHLGQSHKPLTERPHHSPFPNLRQAALGSTAASSGGLL